MLGKKIVSFRKLAKKLKVIGGVDHQVQEGSHEEYLLKECWEGSPDSSTTPTGFFAVYVGEERQRFVVQTSFLNHPLFKMLLEKSYNEFGFEQSTGLVVPCTVSTFQEVLNAVECSNGKFDFGKLVEDFV